MNAPAATLPPESRRLEPRAYLDVVRSIVTAGDEFWLGATGCSMAPTIRNGDDVLLGRCDTARVRVGQIVLAMIDERAVLHRVIRIDGDRLHLRGDALFTEDAPIRRDEVIARALAAARGDRVISLVPTTRFGTTASLRGMLALLRQRIRRARDSRGLR